MPSKMLLFAPCGIRMYLPLSFHARKENNMIINLKNPAGFIKQAKLGFSWTMLFFGFFVPLIRGDIKWFLISLIAPFVTFSISLFVLPFLYNKFYIKGLLAKGWLPADEVAANALRAKGIFVPQVQQ